MNIRNKAWMFFLSMMLAVCMLLSPTAAMAQEGESHAEQEESSKIDMTSLILVTKRIWEDVVTDPGSIFFIEKLADSSIRPNTIEANVGGQGTSIKELINYTLLITKVGSAYRAWQQEKGQPVTLCDQTAEDYDVSSVITTGDNYAWNITPENRST